MNQHPPAVAQGDIPVPGTHQCSWSLGGHDLRYVKVEAANGIEHIRVQCQRCKKVGARSYKRDVLAAGQFDQLLVVRSNACKSCGGPGCADCVANPCTRIGCVDPYLNVHEHHVLHRHVNEVLAEQFPKVPLCQACHSELHAAFELRYRTAAA